MNITIEVPFTMTFALRAVIAKALAGDPTVAALVAELNKHGIDITKIKIV